MDHRITQCPRCGTSFRVTEAHLAVAAGAVRCGSCLHIFNAREHWAEDTAGQPAPEPAAAPQEPDIDDLIIDDDALFDDNTPLFAEERTSGALLLDEPSFGEPLIDTASPVRTGEALFNEADFSTTIDFDTHDDSDDSGTSGAATGDDLSLIHDSPEELTSTFSDLGNWDDNTSARFGRVEDLDEELSASDEEWTRDLLRDDEPLFTASRGNEAESSPAPSFEAQRRTPPLEDYGLVAAEPAGTRREPTFGDTDLAAADSFSSTDDLSFLDDDPLLAASTPPRFDEPTPTIEPPDTLPGTMPDLNPEFLDTPPAHRAEPSAVDGETGATGRAPLTLEGSTGFDAPETIVTDASYAGTLPADSPATAAPRGSNMDPLASLDRLATEPLQIHSFRHEPRWPRVLWGLALIALLLALAGQYVHSNFEMLARGQARPWLAQACTLAGCALPPQSDVGQIRSGNLIVRSHPTRQGALVVDAIITNLATFPQPYPQLQLQFSDLNGAPVAGRRFLPGEYLAGELSGAALMPVQQPVHIAIELVDPGPQAVNYSLTVVPPSSAP